MGQLGARLVQGLLGELAFRYVLKSADEHGMTLALPHNASHAAQVLHSASRSHNPESKLDIRARHSARDHSVERRLVLGVDRVPTHLECDLGRGIELEDTESLVRKVVLVGHQIRDEAARFAYPLGFGKTKVGLLDLRLRPFALVNVRKQDVPAHNMALSVTQTSSAHAKPAVCALGASKTLIKLVRISSFKRVRPQGQSARQVVWMNGVVGTPILQFCETFPEVI